MMGGVFLEVIKPLNYNFLNCDPSITKPGLCAQNTLVYVLVDISLSEYVTQDL